MTDFTPEQRAVVTIRERLMDIRVLDKKWLDTLSEHIAPLLVAAEREQATRLAALRAGLESVKVELQDMPGDNDRLARVLSLAKVEELLR